MFRASKTFFDLPEAVKLDPALRITLERNRGYQPLKSRLYGNAGAPDLNEDFERDGNVKCEGLFGVNQHWRCDMPKSAIGKASAGCLVGRTRAGHRQFMQLCNSDARYFISNRYRFVTPVLPASEVLRS